MKVATLVIITRGKKVLLGLKKGSEIGAGTLNGPGGKVEPGETLIDCVVRETKEEVGITLDPDQLQKVAKITFYAAGVPDFEVHVYRAGRFTGEPRETKSMAPKWYNIALLPIERMLESDRAWFLRAIQGDTFCANVYYRERARGFEYLEFLAFAE